MAEEGSAAEGWAAVLERLCACKHAAAFKQERLYTAVEGESGWNGTSRTDSR